MLSDRKRRLTANLRPRDDRRDEFTTNNSVKSKASNNARLRPHNKLGAYYAPSRRAVQPGEREKAKVERQRAKVWTRSARGTFIDFCLPSSLLPFNLLPFYFAADRLREMRSRMARAFCLMRGSLRVSRRRS